MFNITFWEFIGICIIISLVLDGIRGIVRDWKWGRGPYD